MEEHIEFLKKINKLTKETGIIIDTFGDQFYDPSLTVKINGEEIKIYFSYDGETYVGRINDPYGGEVIFPEDYEM